MSRLRLLVTYKCPRVCEGCCNKDPSVDQPTDMTFQEVLNHDSKEVYITGGEPMCLSSDLLLALIRLLKARDKKVYIYSAECRHPVKWLVVLDEIDGLTFTIHSKGDAHSFKKFDKMLEDHNKKERLSLRLNAFQEAGIEDLSIFKGWETKQIEWKKSCPVPEETFGYLKLA